MENFKVYPDSVIEELSGADACVWAMGTFDGKFEVEVEYPIAFAKAITRTKRSKKFRYVHLGGALAERDQEKPLWFYEAGRRGRGLGELKMEEFARENRCEDSWETIIMRPSAVLKKDSVSFLSWAIPDSFLIRVDQCAASMIDVVLSGSDKDVWENRTMVQRGRAILEQ